MAWWLLVAVPAFAQEDDGDDIDITNKIPAPAPGDDWTKTKSGTIVDVEDEPVMRDFAAEQRKKPPPPVIWHGDVAGKQPLTDTFELQVVAFAGDLVLTELPVLVATDRASFVAQHPGGLLVMAEVTSGGTKRTVVEQITPDSVYESAPTLVFLQAAVPNKAATDSVRFLVRAQELPPTPDPASKAPPKPPPPPAPPKDLYARTVAFVRPR